MTRPFALVIPAIGLAAGAAAQPQIFADRFQPIRAGVVILDADRPAGGLPQSAAPYAFLQMQRAASQRPPTWNFVNPLAPSLYDDARAARWNAIRTANGFPGAPIAVNSKITKANAAYWEVFLTDLPESSLSQYDVLLVAPSTYLSLNPSEREKLRRFMDKGGTVWVEVGAVDPGAGIDLVNNIPLAVSVDASPAPPQGTSGDTTQPIMSRPNRLSADEVRLLLTNSDFTPPQANVHTLAPLPGAGYRPLYGSLFDEYGALQWVAVSRYASGGGPKPQIMLSRVGDGQMVVTSSLVAVGLNGRTNYDFRANDLPLTPKGVAAAQFAANVVSLADSSRQVGAGSRRNASGLVDVRAPLISKFRAITPAVRTSVPAIYGGFAAMTFADGTLAVYDQDPGRDLDGDGDPDDGIYNAGGTVDPTLRDLSVGQPGDLIWRVNLGTTLSAPVIAPIVSNGTVQPRLFVTDSSGTLRAYRLDLRTGRVLTGSTANHFLWQIAPPSAGGFGAGAAPIAPTIHNNQVYVMDRITNSSGTKARIYVVDAVSGDYLRSPATGGGPYEIGGQSGAVQVDDPSGPPTIGYIPVQDNSGGMDKVMYVPFRGTAGNANATAGFASLWLGSRGERPFAISPNPESDDTAAELEVQTRASQQGGPAPLDPRTIRLSVVDAAGNPLGAGQMATLFTGAVNVGAQAGVVSFPFAGSNNRLPAGFSVRIDYEIDLGQPTSQGVFRGDYRLPDNAGVSRRILGNLALTPRGTIVAVSGTGGGGSGGAIYSIREEGRGTFRMLSRYELFGEHTVSLNGAGPRTVPEVFFDKDPVNRFLPGLGDRTVPIPRLRNFSFQSGPAVKDDKAYVVAIATKPVNFSFGTFQVPSSFLMCFDAEPPVPEIAVGVLPENAVILQPDFGRSVTKTNPDAQSFLGIGPTTYDPDRGVLRLENLAANPRGLVSNALSRSQPLVVRVPNQPDRYLEPDAVGARWSPLRWHYGLLGMSQTSESQPVVVGDTVFVAGASFTPSLFAEVNPPVPVGVLNASDANIAPNDPFLKATDDNGTTNFPYRSWQRQLWTLDPSAGAVGNPHQRWPQFAGIASFEDFVVRLNQTVLRGSGSAFTVVAGEGTALAVGDAGLFAFRKADVILAEEGRISKVDGAGNAVATLGVGASGGNTAVDGATRIVKYVRPNRAYPVGENELLVSDPGADRVVRVGEDGVERRTITSFAAGDALALPAGTPLRLRNPQDAITYVNYETRNIAGVPTVFAFTRYLIADSGNRRLIELEQASTIDEDGNPLPNPNPLTVSYVSPRELNGRSYEYTSVARAFTPGSGAADGRFVIVAGLANGAPSATALGRRVDGTAKDDRTGSGGLLILDPAGPGGIQTVTKIVTPDVSATPFWDEATAQWAVATDERTLAARRQRTRALTGVLSVTARIDLAETPIPLPGRTAPDPTTIPAGAAYLRVMVCASDGVYELAVPVDGAAVPEAATVIWQLTGEAYRSLRHTGANAPSALNPRGFRPTYARRLDDGDVILVNHYAGTTRGNRPFQGEALQIDGSAYAPGTRNLGFSTLAIRIQLGSLTGTRGLLNPTFADRR